MSILSKAFGVGNPNTSARLNVEGLMRNDANNPLFITMCLLPNDVPLSANRDKKLKVEPMVRSLVIGCNYSF